MSKRNTRDHSITFRADQNVLSILDRARTKLQPDHLRELTQTQIIEILIHEGAKALKLEGDDGGGWSMVNDEPSWDQVKSSFSPEYVKVVERIRSATASNSKLEESNLREVLKSLMEMFDLDSFSEVAEGALQVIEKFPTHSEFWALRARALSALGKGEEAYKDICQAVNLDPKNTAHLLKYFMICVQVHRELEIAPAINSKFHLFSERGRADIVGYIEAALMTGQINKNELKTEILSEVLRARSKG